MENSGKHYKGAILRGNITCMANGWLKQQDEQYVTSGGSKSGRV